MRKTTLERAEITIKRHNLKKKGYITRRELAEKLGVNKQTINQWENRHRDSFPKDIHGLYSLELVNDWLRDRAKFRSNPNVTKPIKVGENGQ